MSTYSICFRGTVKSDRVIHDVYMAILGTKINSLQMELNKVSKPISKLSLTSKGSECQKDGQTDEETANAKGITR